METGTGIVLLHWHMPDVPLDNFEFNYSYEHNFATEKSSFKANTLQEALVYEIL